MNPATHTGETQRPLLILANPLQVQDINLIRSYLARDVHFVFDVSARAFFPKTPKQTSFCSFSNTQEIQDTLTPLFEQNQTVLLAHITGQPLHFCGIPESLKSLKVVFDVLPLWMDNIIPYPPTFFPVRRCSRIHTSSLISSREPDWFSKAFSELLALSDRTFRTHPLLQQHMGRACLRHLCGHQFKTIITDTYQGNKSLKGGMLLALALALSQWVKNHIPEKRFGIVLPPGIAATVTNVASALANKTPVNINFTSEANSIQSAIRQSGVHAIFTAEGVVEKLPHFPWTETRYDILEILHSLPKYRILLWRIVIFILPPSWIARLIGLPEEGGDAEAGLLFTSGSSGEPKGVVLTHSNILGNIFQVTRALPPKSYLSILGCIPIFHSFGFTVTLWWPVCGGPSLVTYISPLEIKHITQAIQQFRPSLLITTPTFLRAFLKRTEPEQLQALKLVVTGAEKLPSPLLYEFQEKFGIPVCEGYGMTETTPVVSVNLPNTVAENPVGPQLLKKVGSVGRMLPGMSVKSFHPETHEVQCLFQTGVLGFSGINVFNGYLDNPEKNAKVLQEGFYISGDVGHVDVDGFLYIDGRESRFSKIGGEMVPHGNIEEKINTVCLKLESHQEPHTIVMGVSHPQKGEMLVALTTSTANPAEMRHLLAEEGLPNLWIPKIIHHTETIPTLASGKLDLQGCQQLAENVAAKSPSPSTSGKSRRSKVGS